MEWTIEQLRAFVISAEKGSFSAAGRTLGKAQSVISTHIAALEDSLGLELFDRSSRSPVLTPAGRDLLPEAHAVLRQLSRFDACAIARFQNELSNINISVSHEIPIKTVSDVIADLNEVHPFTTGSFSIKSLDQVWSDVISGASQLGIIVGGYPEVGDNYEQLCLGQIRYCIVASKDSPLAQMQEVSEQELASHRQIVVQTEGIEKYLLSSQHWVVNDMLCALYWASLNIGWTVAPITLAQHAIRENYVKRLTVLRVSKLSPISFNIYLIWNVLYKNIGAVRFFIDHLQKKYREIQEQQEQIDFFI